MGGLFGFYLLAILSLVQQCHGGNTKKGTHSPRTFDVSAQDGHNGSVWNDAHYDDHPDHYVPPVGTFTSVVDGPFPIWEAQGNEECTVALSLCKDGTKMLTLHIYGNGEVLYYAKDDEGWQVVQDAHNDGSAGMDEQDDHHAQNGHSYDHNDHHSSLRSKDLWSDHPDHHSGSPTVATRPEDALSFTNLGVSFEETSLEVSSISLSPPILDLASPDESICKVVDVSIAGIPAKTYIMKPGADVYKVVRHNDEIWEAESNEKCTLCIALAGRHGLVMLRTAAKFKVTNLFYKYNGGSCCYRAGWQLLAGTSTRMSALRNVQDSTMFTLDISTVSNGEKCQVTREDRDGLSTLIYATKPGHAIMAIMDNGREVWRAGEDHICFLAELHARDNVTLLRLYTKRADAFSYSCFEKRDGKWERIDYIVFDKLLIMMARIDDV